MRKPLSLKFAVDETDARDAYGRLYSGAVVDDINALHVPRYGLGNYVGPVAEMNATPAERKLIENLGRSGKRLMGFCQTNLFKRLESSGFSFLQSIDRHILRNRIYLYAIENGLDLPVGVLDAGLLDAERINEDADGLEGDPQDLLDGLVETAADVDMRPDTLARAKAVYQQYATDYKKRVKWVNPLLFKATLADHLAADTQKLSELLTTHGPWNGARDRKLAELHQLLAKTHAKDKVRVFPRFPTPPATSGTNCARAASRCLKSPPAPRTTRTRWPAASRPARTARTLPRPTRFGR